MLLYLRSSSTGNLLRLSFHRCLPSQGWFRHQGTPLSACSLMAASPEGDLLAGAHSITPNRRQSISPAPSAPSWRSPWPTASSARVRCSTLLLSRQSPTSGRAVAVAWRRVAARRRATAKLLGRSPGLDNAETLKARRVLDDPVKGGGRGLADVGGGRLEAVEAHPSTGASPRP